MELKLLILSILFLFPSIITCFTKNNRIIFLLISSSILFMNMGVHESV